MPQRHSKSERNLEQELDDLLAQIESKVPELTKAVLTSKPASVAPVIATPAPAPVSNSTVTAEAAASTERAVSVDDTVLDSSTDTTDAPAAGNASAEDMLSAQIQALLDDAQKQHNSNNAASASGKPKPMAGVPASIATAPIASPVASTVDADDLGGDFDSPQTVLEQAALPEPTTAERDTSEHRAASTAQATSGAQVSDDEVSRILEQIDDDLSQQADEAVGGEFETVQDVVGVPAQAAAAADANASPVAADANSDTDGATAAQVARELDEQTLQAAGADVDDLSTPIPSIPPEVLAKAAALSPAPPAPTPAATPAPAAQVAASNAVAATNPPPKPAKPKVNFKLSLPPLGSTLRAVLTLINGPLLNINPTLRQAVGILGLGNVMLGTLWVTWLLLTRH